VDFIKTGRFRHGTVTSDTKINIKNVAVVGAANQNVSSLMNVEGDNRLGKILEVLRISGIP
jgi:hypothetical protein